MGERWIREHNFERLKEHIIPLSKANQFDDAKNEWRLVGVQIQEEFDNCPQIPSPPELATGNAGLAPTGLVCIAAYHQASTPTNDTHHGKRVGPVAWWFVA